MIGEYNQGSSPINYRSCLYGHNLVCTLQPMTLADRIKQQRIALGLTQAGLARLAGISQQMIGKLESGTTSETGKIVSLAAALGVPVEWLATGNGPRERDADLARITPAVRDQDRFAPSLGKDYDSIDDIRHANLLALIAEAGGQRALADRVVESDQQPLAPAQISQWVTRAPDARRGKPRVVSSASARRIERAMGRPAGWMDQQHDTPSPPDTTTPAKRAAALPFVLPSPIGQPAGRVTRKLATLLAGLPEAERTAAGALLAALAKTPESLPLRSSLANLLSSSASDDEES